MKRILQSTSSCTFIIILNFYQGTQKEDNNGKGELKEQQLQVYKRKLKEVVVEDPHVPHHDISLASITLPFLLLF